MNIKVRNILIISIIAIMGIIAMPNKANAGLQANKGGTSLTYTTANDFFKTIRRMETQYGTLGKNAQLNDKYIDTTGNGIDCHMALNTEFGTAAILSYSRYGNIIQNATDTTTGNESGICEFGKFQYVAGIYSESNSYMDIILNADARYYNKYERSTSKAGDGLGKLGSGASYPSLATPILTRGGYNNLLGVLNAGAYTGTYSGYMSNNVSSRAVVVCGEGL